MPCNENVVGRIRPQRAAIEVPVDRLDGESGASERVLDLEAKKPAHGERFAQFLDVALVVLDLPAHFHVDDLRVVTERQAFQSMLSGLEKTWDGIIREHGN